MDKLLLLFFVIIFSKSLATPTEQSDKPVTLKGVVVKVLPIVMCALQFSLLFQPCGTISERLQKAK